MINAGESPMNEVLNRTKKLPEGTLLELVTPFVPAPVIEMLIEKGYRVWVQQTSNGVKTYVLKC
jgi:hypothetical protein